MSLTSFVTDSSTSKFLESCCLASIEGEFSILSRKSHNFLKLATSWADLTHGIGLVEQWLKPQGRSTYEMPNPALKYLRNVETEPQIVQIKWKGDTRAQNVLYKSIRAPPCLSRGTLS